MDLLTVLRERVNNLPEGDYTQGIKATLQHIEVASRHLERGQSTADETAFTDAIYRTNQAFEGSLKEAFRVLAVKDPAGERPYDIENYLQQNNILRPRVLAQLTNYRKEWRNPSTHDYRLDFDEDEALLAIVTVSAFAIVLIDQITERVSYEQTKAVAAKQANPSRTPQPLLEQFSGLVEQFVSVFTQDLAGRTDVREAEITGALAGFLSSAAPEINVQTDSTLAAENISRADMILASSSERLIVEVKRKTMWHKLVLPGAITQVSNYMAVNGITQGVVFMFAVPNKGRIIRTEHSVPQGRIVVLSAETIARSVEAIPLGVKQGNDSSQ